VVDNAVGLKYVLEKLHIILVLLALQAGQLNPLRYNNPEDGLLGLFFSL